MPELEKLENFKPEEGEVFFVWYHWTDALGKLGLMNKDLEDNIARGGMRQIAAGYLYELTDKVLVTASEVDEEGDYRDFSITRRCDINVMTVARLGTVGELFNEQEIKTNSPSSNDEENVEKGQGSSGLPNVIGNGSS